MQLKIRKLQLASATLIPTTICTEFDVIKQIRFVTSFQMAEVDKDFLRFKQIASSLEWLRKIWTLLWQSVLLGKAQEAYSALLVDHSSDYDVLKSVICKTYKLVPEPYY